LTEIPGTIAATMHDFFNRQNRLHGRGGNHHLALGHGMLQISRTLPPGKPTRDAAIRWKIPAGGWPFAKDSFWPGGSD